MIKKNVCLLLFVVFIFTPYQGYGASILTKMQDDFAEEIGRRVGVLNAAYLCGMIRDSEVQRYILLYTEEFYKTMTAEQKKQALRAEIFQMFNDMSAMSRKDIKDQGYNCDKTKVLFQKIKEPKL